MKLFQKNKRLESPEFRGDYVQEDPVQLQIETSSLCNLQCVMCPHGIKGFLWKKEDNYLTHAQLVKILNQFPHLEKISLQGMGEPLLNSELPELVAESTSRGITTSFFTNAMLLKRQVVDTLMDARLHRLVISLDAGTEEKLAEIRKGADLAAIVDNVQYLISEKKRRGSTTPYVNIMFVAMPKNIETIPAVIELALELGVDELVIKACSGMALIDEHDWMLSEKDFDELMVSVEKGRKKGLQIGIAAGVNPLVRRQGKLRCQWPWKKAYVAVDGSVTPCCYALPERGVVFGNVLTSDFSEIWNGPKYQSFRKELREGMPAICKNCPDYSQFE